jgi:hypothetical protein
MEKLVASSKGNSKKQLAQVLKTKQDDEEELEEYIKEGRKYLDSLNEKVESLQKMKKGLEEGKTIAEINAAIG